MYMHKTIGPPKNIDNKAEILGSDYRIRINFGITLLLAGIGIRV